MGVIRSTGPFRWEDVNVLEYKETGSHFKDITRQVLLGGHAELGVELRYFEIGAGGHSTLERHEHVHFVVVVRGAGDALVEGRVQRIRPLDLIEIPPRSWHQFRATCGEPFGFFCLVRTDRDKPELPTEAHLAELRGDPAVAAFIRA